jgi:succinoglycan biosynthesis protein ExoU
MPSPAPNTVPETIDATEGVAVIIAAHNAAATIGSAIRSALAQSQTQEVIVVDDASSDGTARAAVAAAEGDHRLHVLGFERNRGPAAARNVAIAASSAPILAPLDADDTFLPGRLGRLLSHEGWDLIADNIAFLPEGADMAQLTILSGRDAGLSALDLAGFVRGNLPRPGQRRGELGFLKPLIRRSFLTTHGLRYDPDLRLGEDYDLYVRALMAGARFFVSHGLGYVAHVRAGSLSGRHGTDDLARLARVAEGHLAALPPSHGAAPSMTRLRDSLRARHIHRACLEEKARGGIGAALSLALNPPSNAMPIARGVLRDKLAALRPESPRDGIAQPWVLIAPPPETEATRQAANPSRA